MSRSARVPVLPAPMPYAVTLGPMAWPGRSIVNDVLAHGIAAASSGNTARTNGDSSIASRRNRTRSAAIAPVAHTIRTRRPGFRPSSHSTRQQIWKLFP